MRPLTCKMAKPYESKSQFLAACRRRDSGRIDRRNDLSRLILDVSDALKRQADEKGRAKLIRQCGRRWKAKLQASSHGSFRKAPSTRPRPSRSSSWLSRDGARLGPLHLVVRETEFCGLRLAGEFRCKTATRLTNLPELRGSSVALSDHLEVLGRELVIITRGSRCSAASSAGCHRAVLRRRSARRRARSCSTSRPCS